MCGHCRQTRGGAKSRAASGRSRPHVCGADSRAGEQMTITWRHVSVRPWVKTLLRWWLIGWFVKGAVVLVVLA
jgi:hypothetical protein